VDIAYSAIAEKANSSEEDNDRATPEVAGCLQRTRETPPNRRIAVLSLRR